MLLTTQAVVLQTTRHEESSLIVHLFTEEAGMVHAVARNPRTRAGRNRAGTRLLQPLALVEVSLNRQASRPLSYIKEVHTAEPFFRIPSDPIRGSIAFFLAEFLNYALAQEGENRPLFAFLRESFRRLDRAERGIPNFHIAFLFRLSLFLGIRPLTESYTRGAFFDLREAAFVATRPYHPDVLQPEEATQFALMLRMSYDTMHLFALSRQQRNRCLELLLRYYKLHIPSLPELKSYDVLKELFV
ncbi:MAG: DNA repair protein RecO [Bacteroidaceae bacterium]|jgi:DNA repair protein RecO (recombination protein O)